MKDLKFERKRSLSRLEAADQLTALADALRAGGEAELRLGDGTLSLRIPDELRSEVELEVGDGEIELEIELKWSTDRPRRTAPSRAVAGSDRAAKRSAPKRSAPKPVGSAKPAPKKSAKAARGG
ncbi:MULTISPECIES: amphi-Trp domain-containing protein [unclassified Streptomyces]|uniref:amphi-Trp domain-containing protein n=1 Tax=unclassified Streptomyces TaxID=2593676 RepID=UPI00296771AA|nr:amphi-Trp domain-containing protein [Streptomyces sp. SJL17-1]